MKFRVIQVVLGFVCTALFLVLALYHVQLDHVVSAVAQADPVWIGAAMAAYAVDLLLRTQRWRLVLRPVAAIPYWTVGRALLVGYGMNTIMPARLGELFRVEFFKRSYGLSRIWALTSIVIERLLDGMAVVGLLGIGLFFTTTVTSAGGVLVQVLILGAALFGGVLLVAFVLSSSRVSQFFLRFHALSPQLIMIQRSFEILRSRRMTIRAAVLTLFIYVPEVFAQWCIVKAVGITLGPFHTMILVGTTSLSTLVPSGPAFLGTLQFAYALGIEFAGGDRTLGIAAATLCQLCLLLPIAVISVTILIHASGNHLFALLTNRYSDEIDNA